MGVDELESIQHLDVLPENIAQQIVDSAGRNKLIVETYKKKQSEYGQTIVFAINVVHAIQLSAEHFVELRQEAQRQLTLYHL